MTDTDYMRQCFLLAERGRHTCRPNPVVGCVVVNAGTVVGEGWHAVAGQAHAEVLALQQAGSRAAGATVFVSLEPCVHFGRTGPCTDALIASGISRLVFGMQDPNPLVAGKGLQKLRDHGIEVSGPLLPDAAAALNPGFVKRMLHKRPYVRCKLAMSLDAGTAMRSGESQWITGTAAREDGHRLRARSCAVITGRGTVIKDDPALTVRVPGYDGRQPLRVVLDSTLRTPAAAKVFQQAGDALLVAAGNAAALESAAERYGHCRSTVQLVALPVRRGGIDLRVLLLRLAADWQCNEVLVEAGPVLAGAFLQAGLVDELVSYVAPCLLGHEALPLAVLAGMDSLQQKVRLRFLDAVMLGEDLRIRSEVLAANPQDDACSPE